MAASSKIKVVSELYLMFQKHNEMSTNGRPVNDL